MTNELPQQDLRIIRTHEVMLITGLSRSAIYAAIKAGSFPAQLKLSARSSGWVRAEVVKWVVQRPRGI